MSTIVQTARTKRTSEKPTAWWVRMKRAVAEWRDRDRARHESPISVTDSCGTSDYAATTRALNLSSRFGTP